MKYTQEFQLNEILGSGAVHVPMHEKGPPRHSPTSYAAHFPHHFL